MKDRITLRSFAAPVPSAVQRTTEDAAVNAPAIDLITMRAGLGASPLEHPSADQTDVD